MSVGGPDQTAPLPALTPAQAQELARRHGLEEVGIRPPLRRYVRELWVRRRFLLTLATAETVSRNQNNYLGQLWAVLNPLMLAGAYFLIFGILLDTREGTENFIGFLVAGLFVFLYSSSCIVRGSRSVIDNTGLMRALRFPRAMLPLSVVLTEFVAALPTFAVLLVIVGITEGTVHVTWLLFPVALLIVTVMNAGIALMGARLMHGSRDIVNTLPIVVRMLRYISGVFYSVERFGSRLGPVGAVVLTVQPIAVALTVVRETLLAETPLRWQTWTLASAWALGFFVVGLVVFWREEARYGRG